jgi:AcrR family transcriptional regulator
MDPPERNPTHVTRGDALLDGLLDIYLAEGFRHLGVADLARRLKCSKTTLYSIAPSKEQIVIVAVRAFFRAATERVEHRTALPGQPRDRIATYLQAIADELRPAGPAFIADVEAFAPAREIYQRNTQAAAHRVQDLIAEARTGSTQLDPRFVGVVARLVMEAIQRGTISREANLEDSQAYAALSDLLIAGLS